MPVSLSLSRKTSASASLVLLRLHLVLQERQQALLARLTLSSRMGAEAEAAVTAADSVTDA